MIYRIVQFVMRIVMKMMRLKLVNGENIPLVQDCIVCANHISANDPPMLGSVIPQKINYLAKRELFKRKWFGKILYSINVIPVRRGRFDRRALQLVKERLAKGQSIMIFPEGTRRAAKIKAGTGKFALEMQKNIMPVYIENSDKMLDCILGKKRLKIVFGDMIEISMFKDMEHTKENFQYVSEYVMRKINELKDRD